MLVCLFVLTLQWPGDLQTCSLSNLLTSWSHACLHAARHPWVQDFYRFKEQGFKTRGDKAFAAEPWGDARSCCFAVFSCFLSCAVILNLIIKVTCFVTRVNEDSCIHTNTSWRNSPRFCCLYHGLHSYRCMWKNRWLKWQNLSLK